MSDKTDRRSSRWAEEEFTRNGEHKGTVGKTVTHGGDKMAKWGGDDDRPFLLLWSPLLSLEELGYTQVIHTLILLSLFPSPQH